MDAKDIQNLTPEIWQVEVNGQIYETNLDEMAQWITEGSLLPNDRVRRGNLRWLSANKVPLLYGFFNAKELGIETSKISTSVSQPVLENSQFAENQFPTAQTFIEKSINEQNFVNPKATFVSSQTQYQQLETQIPDQNSCVIHEGEEPKFKCDTCSNIFCKNCPSTYGTVKICPMCGAMCQALTEVKQKQQLNDKFQFALSEGFGFSDFGKALVFPFKYKASLIFGAIMYMFFTLGQGASAIGGIFMIVSAIFCAMMANTLTFGILANTVENFSQGKTETDFMPSFEDFNLWDDVLHPFFLSIGVYISSFGPLIAVIFVMFFFAMNSTKPDANSPGLTPVVATVAPDMAADYEGTSQTKQIKGITDQVKEINSQHNQQIDSVENKGETINQSSLDEEKRFNEINDQINQTRKKQLESTIGKSPETEKAEITQFVQKLLSVTLPFLILAGLGLLWALFYFPAACAVAGYTRNFVSTVNPLVGIDTAKRMGLDYFKILGMSIILSIISFTISGILRSVLSPLEIPRFGNLPAIAIGSFVTFYFSIVFSVLLGYALYKNSNKLKLYR